MTRAPAPTEDDFQRRIIDTARLHGWRLAHFRPARTARGWATPITGDVGFPDLVLARHGTVILAELKSDTGGLGPGQPEWLVAAGAHARLWRPVDWPAILAELEH
jgi:hypothetical protein